MSDLFKRCNECRKWLEVRRFYKHPAQPDGLMPHCKSCQNCGVVRDRPVYGNGERQWGDPTEEQIAAECLRFQAGWSQATRESRRRVRAMR